VEKLNIKIDLDPQFVIKNHVSLINEGVDILKSQLDQIELVGRRDVVNEEVLEETRLTILVAKRNYLDLFAKIATFLSEKLETEDLNKFIFYLPNVRAIIEIYAYLLHWCSEDDSRQVALVLSKTFETLAKIMGDSDGEYNRQLQYNKLLIDYWNISIPQRPGLFTFKYVQDNKINYPSVKTMLDKKRILDASPQTSGVFPIAKNDPYLIYSHFSNYVHGNSLTKDSHGTESFWVISELLIKTSLVVELVDNKMLGGINRDDISVWLSRVKPNIPSLYKVWTEARNKKMAEFRKK
jgi:hypothetical protein